MSTPASPVSLFRINQTGYAPRLPVHAAVLTGAALRLTDPSGRMVRCFPSASPRFDPASGDEVVLRDLGPLPEGRYLLEGAGEKRELTVSARPWRAVGNALIKGLFYQRCGCALEEGCAGRYAHGPCHTLPKVDWLDRTVRKNVAGGWHDAGDYGRYTGPGAVAAAHLLYAWKLFPGGCSDDLGIPETGCGMPDILSEARYEVEWLLKMQRSDGAFHHKLTKARFAPFIMPEEDRETEYLMPVSHCATAAACACLALGGRVYREFDRPFADRLRFSALRAWEWLRSHPDFVPFSNPEGVRTGQYGDRSDLDERFWAACELYALTGEEPFRTEAERLYAPGQDTAAFGWADVGGLGALCCLFDLKEKAGNVLYDGLKADFLRRSGEKRMLSLSSGYGTALSPEGYVWGSILPVMSAAMAMIGEYLLTGRREALSAALLQWDYALGLNCLDTCFVTGFGERTVLHPHHRPSGADGIFYPVPGLISGGPNGRVPYPATAEKLKGLPPAKCYLDEEPSADTNEVAVYWNSPAVFTAAFFNSITGNDPRRDNE